MTFSSVDCAEEPGTRVEAGTDKEGYNASVTLRCTWANRLPLITDIVYGHRPWPWEPKLVGRKFKTKGINTVPGEQTGGQLMVYQNALVTITYEPLDFKEGNDEEVIKESLVPSVEFRTLNYQDFTWGENGRNLKEQEAPGKQVHGMSVQRSISNLKGPLPVELFTLQGKTNQEVYYSEGLRYEFPAQTLLYVQPSLTYSLRASGEIVFDVEMQIDYKADGWNVFWHASTQEYEEIWTKAKPAVGEEEDDDYEAAVEAARYYNYPPADLSAILY